MTFRRKWLKRALVGVALAVLTSIVALYAMRSRAVLWRPYKGEVESIGGPSFSIINPFRNRESERPAEAFLNMLKTGECDTALATLPFDEAYRSYVCGRKQNTICYRGDDRCADSPGRARMFYWVTVEKQGAGWQVTG